MIHSNPDLLIDESIQSGKIDILTAPSNQILVCKELLLHIDLLSITTVKATPNQIEVGDPALAIPSKDVILWSYQNGQYLELTRLVIVRYFSPYRENLLSYFTDLPAFILAPGGRIAISIRERGTGLLGSGDRLRVFGQAFTTSSYETDQYFSSRE